MREQSSYFLEALREPLNLAGLLVLAMGGALAGATGVVNPVIVVAAGAVMEGLYLAAFSNSSFYRRRVDQRSRQLDDGRRKTLRQELIRTFDQRERDAVAYLSWMKNQIAGNYIKLSGPAATPLSWLSSSELGKLLSI